MNEILVPISPGELLDKITILQIKTERMDDPEKIANVTIELNALNKVWSDSVNEDDNNEDIKNIKNKIIVKKKNRKSKEKQTLSKRKVIRNKLNALVCE